MGVNIERGDVPVILDGREFVMRPTYQAMTEIETSTGEKLVPLVWKFQEKQFGISDQVAIVTAGLRAAGEPATPEKIGEMILKSGILNDDLLRAIDAFFVMALTGGREVEPVGNETPAVGT